MCLGAAIGARGECNKPACPKEITKAALPHGLWAAVNKIFASRIRRIRHFAGSQESVCVHLKRVNQHDPTRRSGHHCNTQTQAPQPVSA